MDHRVERKRERVILETARYRVDGEIMLPPEGYKSRLSDHLNEPQREFLIVLDASLTPFEDPERRFRSGFYGPARSDRGDLPRGELADMGAR